MDYYAEQNMLVKIAIFIIVWNVIGLYNKIVYPATLRLKIPRGFRCILCGLFVRDSFSIILLPMQVGNYILFVTYFLGGIFGFLNKLPKQNNQTTTSNFPCNFNFAVSNMNRFNQGIYHG